MSDSQNRNQYKDLREPKDLKDIKDLKDQKNHLANIRHQVLINMLMISTAAAAMSMVVNAINSRPWPNLVFPGLVIIVMLILNDFARNRGSSGYKIAKYGVLIFLNVLYIPGAWLTSPGSTSAMPYYCMAIFILGIILAEENWEIVFPVVTALEVLVLFQVERFYPDMFYVYTDLNFRMTDLTINYSVATIIMFMLVYRFTRNYKQSHDHLYHLSITDPLTGLYNRRYMMSTLEAQHNASLRKGEPYCIILIDIDHFKSVNDTYGHLEGDTTLRVLGSILQNESRSYDVCCRYGGDEFMVILPHTAQNEAEIFAKRMKSRFTEYAERFRELQIDLTIGVTERKDQTLEQMIAAADQRLYMRKQDE